MIRMEGSDEAAVARARGGDPDAFRALVERHSRHIFRLGYRMTGNEHDAEEIVQETFLRAYRRLNKFESRANFGTWLYRIAVNCSLDLVRSRGRHDNRREVANADDPQSMDAYESAAPAPDRLALSGELGERVKVALDALSPAERAAFVMRHFDGYSIEEIARALDLGANATKNTIFRAVHKLRAQLRPLVTST